MATPPPTLTDLSLFAVPVTLYIFGFVSGYLVSTWVGGLTKADMQERIALLITLIWITSVTAGIILPDYDTAVWIHAIMGGVAGYLFSGETGLSILPGEDSHPSRRHPPHDRAHGAERSTRTEDPRAETDDDDTDDTNSHP